MSGNQSTDNAFLSLNGNTSRLRHRIHIHVEDFPDVSVRIGEGTAVHPAVVFRLAMFICSVFYSFLNQAIDFVAAGGREGCDHFRVPGRVAQISE